VDLTSQQNSLRLEPKAQKLLCGGIGEDHVQRVVAREPCDEDVRTVAAPGDGLGIQNVQHAGVLAVKQVYRAGGDLQLIKEPLHLPTCVVAKVDAVLMGAFGGLRH
jgi:hypothetical protein